MKPEQIFKKTVAAALLLIAAAPLLMSIMFIAQQQRIHFEMDRHENEKNISITVPASNIQWIRKGKELIANGRMMDVKSISIKNGMATITGHYDEKEEKLLAGFSKNNIEKKSPYSAGSSSAKFIFLPLFYLYRTVDDAKQSKAAIKVHRSYSTEKIINAPSETETPPPRFLA
jgi:hypothetical protein